MGKYIPLKVIKSPDGFSTSIVLSNIDRIVGEVVALVLVMLAFWGFAIYVISEYVQAGDFTNAYTFIGGMLFLILFPLLMVLLAINGEQHIGLTRENLIISHHVFGKRLFSKKYPISIESIKEHTTWESNQGENNFAYEPTTLVMVRFDTGFYIFIGQGLNANCRQFLVKTMLTALEEFKVKSDMQ